MNTRKTTQQPANFRTKQGALTAAARLRARWPELPISIVYGYGAISGWVVQVPGARLRHRGEVEAWVEAWVERRA